MLLVGQEKLLNKIDRLTLSTMPHSLILLGEVGCGKKTLCNHLSKVLMLPLEDITENLTAEYLDKLMLKVEPYIYMIRAKDITIKDENTILKFLEEPLKNAYIIICCDSKSQLIPTIINRCQLWEFEKYSKEELRMFTDDENILKFVKTPGQVEKLKGGKLNDMVDLANKIFDKMSLASIPNALSIANKMAFKNEQELFDFDSFMLILVDTIVNKIKEDENVKLLKYFELTSKLNNEKNIPHINKKYLFENYILKMKEV